MNESTEQLRRVVVGLGKTGLSCARYFAARDLPFAVVDSREVPPLLGEFRAEFPQIAVSLGSFDEALLREADEIVLSPGVNPTEPAIQGAQLAGARLFGDIELFYREARAPIVAITGTNAKSTVTTLVGLMADRAGLRAGCGGNLGTPALELLAQDVDLYVLELSSFQLEIVIDFQAEVAAMLNLAPDHLDRYPDMAAYHRAKQRIFRGARSVVFNRDDAMTQPPLTRNVRQISFGLSQPEAGAFGLLRADGVDYLACGAERLLAIHELGLSGRHNVANALAALAIASAAGIEREAQLEVLRSYRGLPHRCQHVRSLDGIDFYDDSKGTNVAATVAAIRGLAADCAGRIVLIAGGLAKESDFSALVEELVRCAGAVVLIGTAAPMIAQALGDRVKHVDASSMDEAVAAACRLSSKGDIVLLSPACASFDMFRNYEERGQAFSRAVLALADAEGC